MADFLPVADGAKTLLTAHAASSGWGIEVGVMPPSPDKIIMITDTGGIEPPNPRFLLDFPTLQIMVRGVVSGYILAWSEAKAVKDILLGVTSQTVNGDRWVAVNIDGDLAFIGRDDNDRPLFTINFRLILEPKASPETNRIAL